MRLVAMVSRLLRQPTKANRPLRNTLAHDLNATGCDHPFQAVVAVLPIHLTLREHRRDVGKIRDHVFHLLNGLRHAGALARPRQPISEL